MLLNDSNHTKQVITNYITTDKGNEVEKRSSDSIVPPLEDNDDTTLKHDTVDVNGDAKLCNNDSNQQEKKTIQEQIKSTEYLYEQDKILQQARIIRSIPGYNEDVLDEKQLNLMKKVKDMEKIVADLKSHVPDDGWIKQKETKGIYPADISYKLVHSDKNDKTTIQLRVETPVDKSLLVPILSVLNESELYSSWMPNWKHPRLNIRKVEKLSQSGRVSQIIIVTMDLPWPLATREIVLSATGCDDIEEKGDIVVHLTTLKTGDANGLVPPPEANAVRVDLDGAFLFQMCPKDHPAAQRRVHSTTNTSSSDGGDNTEMDELVLVTFGASMDPNLKLIPQSFLNFVMRTAFGMLWNMLLKVAQDVKDGKRLDHSNAINAKRQVLYDWVDERVDTMLHGNSDYDDQEK